MITLPIRTAPARAAIATYRIGQACPGCGRSHWHVGRATAECAFCATAMPLALGCRTAGHATRR